VALHQRRSVWTPDRGPQPECAHVWLHQREVLQPRTTRVQPLADLPLSHPVEGLRLDQPDRARTQPLPWATITHPDGGHQHRQGQHQQEGGPQRGVGDGLRAKVWHPHLPVRRVLHAGPQALQLDHLQEPAHLQDQTS